MSSTGVKLLAVVVGFWIIMRSVRKDAKGDTLINKITGTSGSASQALPASTTASTAGGGATIAGQLVGNLSALAKAPASKGTDPVPGATGSRLDQGFDLTSSRFVAPFNGKVVKSTPSDPGWAGGGYLAIQDANNPKRVQFFAEGLLPTVHVGQNVVAGQQIALPARNPYNGITGNIEWGPANPSNPGQPLAQVISNPRAAVLAFYAWARSIGAPAATSTSNAGRP